MMVDGNVTIDTAFDGEERFWGADVRRRASQRLILSAVNLARSNAWGISRNGGKEESESSLEGGRERKRVGEFRSVGANLGC